MASTTNDPVLKGLKDNIEDADVDIMTVDAAAPIAPIAPIVPPQSVAEATTEAGDELIKRFDEVQASVEKGAKFVSSLKEQPHDEARVQALIKYCIHMQRQNEMMYDLLVEMNNFFGAK